MFWFGVDLNQIEESLEEPRWNFENLYLAEVYGEAVIVPGEEVR